MDVFSKPAVPQQPSAEILEEIGSVTRRLKLLENAVSTMRSSLQNLEQNFIESNKENRRDIKTLEEENDDLKTTVRSMKETLKTVSEELQNTARSEEVKVIQKYLELWSPVRFTTVDAVRKIVHDEFEELQERQNPKQK